MSTIKTVHLLFLVVLFIKKGNLVSVLSIIKTNLPKPISLVCIRKGNRKLYSLFSLSFQMMFKIKKSFRLEVGL